MFPIHDAAFIIGRFQVDRLHDGHVKLIQSVLKRQHTQAFVVLGVAPFASDRNPMGFQPRARMIQSKFPQVTVLPLADARTDREWSESLDALVRMVMPSGRPVLFGARDSFVKSYSGRFETVELEGDVSASGTEERARIMREVRDSEDFRAGLMHAIGNSPARVFTTVDVGVFCETKGEHHLLLGRRSDGLLRLPGGFVDGDDASVMSAARRELKEETGIDPQAGLKSHGVFKVKDWRLSPGYAIFTNLFSVSLGKVSTYPELTDSDDLSEPEWFPLHTVTRALGAGFQKRIAPEHTDLVESLLMGYRGDKDLKAYDIDMTKETTTTTIVQENA